LGIGIHYRTRTNAAAANDNRRGTILRFIGILLFYFHGVADWALAAGSEDSACAPDPLCPDCRCGAVTVIAQSRYAAGQLLQANGMFFRSDQSFAGIFGVRHAYRGQQLRSTLFVSPSFFNVNHPEVVNTTILSFLEIIIRVTSFRQEDRNHLPDVLHLRSKTIYILVLPFPKNLDRDCPTGR
jgi:hypothetical protein